MANHLKTMRQMQDVFKPNPEPEPELKHSKRLWETDYGLYTSRTMRIMEEAASMKPVPAILDKYQGTDYLSWQFDKKARDARHVEWLASLDAMEA